MKTQHKIIHIDNNIIQESAGKNTLAEQIAQFGELSHFGRRNIFYYSCSDMQLDLQQRFTSRLSDMASEALEKGDKEEFMQTVDYYYRSGMDKIAPWDISPYEMAAEQGTTEIMRATAKRIGKHDKRGQNRVLLCAIAAGDYELIQQAIDDGANVNESDIPGTLGKGFRGFLYMTSILGDAQTAEVLLDAGANPNGPENNNMETYYPPLVVCEYLPADVLSGSPATAVDRMEAEECMQRVLAGQLDTSGKMGKDIIEGRRQIAGMLLDRGANPNLYGADGISPVLAAAASGNLEGLKELREYEGRMDCMTIDTREDPAVLLAKRSDVDPMVLMEIRHYIEEDLNSPQPLFNQNTENTKDEIGIDNTGNLKENFTLEEKPDITIRETEDNR